MNETVSDLRIRLMTVSPIVLGIAVPRLVEHLTWNLSTHVLVYEELNIYITVQNLSFNKTNELRLHRFLLMPTDVH